MKKKDYTYLLHLYSRTDGYLAGEKDGQLLPDIVVSFCIFVERVFKIKLHEKNPILIFDTSKIKETDTLLSIICEKEKNIDTIKIYEVIYRFKVVYKDIFSEDEFQALKDVYSVRNGFVHGYRGDTEFLEDEEDIVKKMGTIWEKISVIATELFGKENIIASHPKKKYSEEELEEVLIEEVKKMLETRKVNDVYGRGRYYLADMSLPNSVVDASLLNSYGSAYNLPYPDGSVYGIGEECPRCGARGFSKETGNFVRGVYDTMMLDNSSDLYKCKKCHLELTEKQYEIAKKLKRNLVDPTKH